MRLRKVAVLFAAISIFASSTFAYDADTHFWLTYYLAIQVGYTPDQARKIASLDVSVDYSDKTEPIQARNRRAEDVRREFHALPLTKRVDGLRETLKNSGRLAELNAEVTKLVDTDAAVRWQEAMDLRNPGIYLHFFEDRFAHRGFTSRVGHSELFHLPDFLASDPEKAEMMARATVVELSRFMRESNIGTPHTVSSDSLHELITQLIDANFYNAVRLDSYYPNWQSWDWKAIHLSLKNTYFIDSPNVQKARIIIDGWLKKSQAPDWVLWYDLKESGNLRADRSVGFLTEKKKAALFNLAETYELDKNRAPSPGETIAIY